MSRYTDRFWSIASVVTMVVSVGSAQTEARKTAHGVTETVTDLKPLTHTALIPVGADLSSIRFQGLKAVKIPTSSRSTIDERYCAEIANQDPGGSMYCPLLQAEAFTLAYQVTYSFEGQPLASDEFANRHFTFNVYFRPAELRSAEWAALARRLGGRTDTAGFFKLTTSRVLEEQRVIDGDHSIFCDGNYRDGMWVHMDSQCEDIVDFKNVMLPSDYFAVRVDLAPLRAAASISAK